MSFCSSHGSDLAKGVCKDCRIAELESALWTQQCAVEYAAEHYRQSDNGWDPSPGYDRSGTYEAKVAYANSAEAKRLRVLGIESWKHDVSLPGEKYHWIVQRTYPEHKPRHPELHPDELAALPRIVTALKQSDGESWAVGDFLEKHFEVER